MSATATSRVHFRTCNLCEAMCGLRIELEGEKITAIRGDDEDPFSRGHVCPKALALKDLHEDPDRLRHPMRRTATGWERVSWDDALDEAAKRIHAVQKEHGRDAVASYLGNPNVHNLGNMVFGPELVRALRSRNRFSATSVDQLPHQLVSYFMFGHQLLTPIPDLDRTQYLLVMGANPLASNGSLMTAPDIRARLRAIQQRGGKLIVVDPRRTESAAIADSHIFIRPGTDALALLALLHVVLVENMPRASHLAAHLEGLEAVRELARDFPPERVAPHTGVPAETLRGIARDFLSTEQAVCYGRMGLSTQPFGSLCQWLINVLNTVTGNLDRQGGAMFTQPAFDVVGGPKAMALGRGSYGRWKSRVRGLPEVGGELPAAVLAEEMLTPGEGRIRALVTMAGNPVLSTPNGPQLERALEGLDFMVSLDPYLNETTRHANLILPPVSPLERGHYDVAFHVLSVRNTAKYSPPLFQPGPEGRQDWQVVLALQHRLENLRRGRPSLRQTLKYQALTRMGPERVLDIGLRMGPYGARFHPLRDGLSLAKLRASPHGVDLGPLQPCLLGRLQTKDRRIQLAPAPLMADVRRLRETFPEGAACEPRDGELLLIGRRHLRDNNSWMHNVAGLVKGKPRCTLMVHPEDASRLGLVDGVAAVVTSRVGEVTVPVAVTDDVMRGVVSLPHGYGHRRQGTGQRIAAEHAGISQNDLTDDRAVDLLSGNAAFNGTPVKVKPAEVPGAPATPAA
ncbi:molybdopterin-dependent oxidoreductase [Myxococcus sp. CA051A]|uniref:molybdopterin oxidoreductase family protein n=1 Tax=unclassified Myxococcus TaxID=2648731 RepID=UPI00157A7D93|nr:MULTISPECIES: molybdopterin oxidoreductase family protein [unclassified Myxococcus]NTX54194.1 molybdopterin-dependent oxidoreductase [Myxococcus sp. CA039A]NTX64930.1 molybdopterin-dependent oxidoreductase [Myxococcus sp. CA051A]